MPWARFKSAALGFSMAWAEWQAGEAVDIRTAMRILFGQASIYRDLVAPEF